MDANASLYTRRDGRAVNQIRPLAVEQGPLNKADGSARFVQGNSSVLAAVYGPAPARAARMEKLDRARVEVEFKPESGISTPAEADLALLIRKSLEEVVSLSRYPRCVVLVVLQVNASQQFSSHDDAALVNPHDHRRIWIILCSVTRIIACTMLYYLAVGPR